MRCLLTGAENLHHLCAFDKWCESSISLSVCSFFQPNWIVLCQHLRVWSKNNLVVFPHSHLGSPRARHHRWIYGFLKPTQFPIGQTSRIDVILDVQDLTFLCITHNTCAEDKQKQTTQTQMCWRNTETQDWGIRLPNQKLRVTWAASLCIWEDAR